MDDQQNVPTSLGRKQTFGEKLAGVSFNPSNDNDVDNVKRAAADFMDAIQKARLNVPSAGDAKSIPELLWDRAILTALDAQMHVVKAITWEY